MTTRYYTNSCSNDGLDPNCFCYGFGPSSQYKIYDVETAAYLCCGNINFNIAVDPANTLAGAKVRAAAEADDPRCLGWWYGSAQNFDATGLTLPQPIVNFFLPDATLTNGNMPYSYGPANQDLLNASYQSSLNTYFKTPTNAAYPSNSSFPQGTTATCASGNIYWLNHTNPNKGLEFVMNMVCLDNSLLPTLKNDTLYTNGNWALYLPNCASGSTESVCNQAVGEVIAPPNTSKIGNLFLATPSYTGGNSIPGKTVEKSKAWIVWLIISIVVVVLIVVLILVFTVFRKKKAKVTDDSSDDGDSLDDSKTSDYETIE